MSERDRAYFDGRCGMCRRTSRALHRLDWLGRLEFIDMTSVAASELPVDMDTALQGMPMRTSGGSILIGFPAVRRALFQTPLGAVPGAILYLPGFSHAGRAIYGVVARRRRRDVCAIETHQVR